jgi:hypothetical protein
VQLWAEAFPTLSDDDRLFIARNILVAPNVDDVGSPRSDFTAPPLSGMFREHIDNSDLSRLSASLMQLPASTIAAVFSSTRRPSMAPHPPQACIDTVRNKDLDPLLPLLHHTMVHVEETAETIYRLGQCVVNLVIFQC